MKKPSNLIRVLSLLFLLPVVLTVQAEKKYSLGGRLFLDGGIFTASPACFNSGVGISDLRITGKADFGDGWYTKLDVGFASNKVRLKDAFLQKTKNGHSLSVPMIICS